MTLPDSLATGPVTVAANGKTFGVKLQGATGTGSVTGSTETWAGALPGVDAALTANSTGVKETLTLHSAAQQVFAYTLTVPSGVTPSLGADGSVQLTAGATLLGALPAAFMDDASHTAAGHSTDVPYTLAQLDATTWTVTVTPSHSWLSDAARVFPVVVDPTVWINYGTGYVGCGIVASTPTTSHCTDTTFGVGSNAGNYRGVAYFPALQNTIPLDSQVTEGDFYPIATSALNGTSQSLSVYPINGGHPPTSGATWNTYDGTHAWTTAGGDFSTTAAGSATLPPGTGARQSINITNLVQDWLTGAQGNQGIVVKATTEPAANLDYFDSSATGNGPELKVTYQARFGSKATSSFTTRQITDRQTLKVNNANGNLVIDATDFNINAPSLTTAVTHTFNSQRNTVKTTLGYGWAFDTGRDVRAQVDLGSGDIYYTAPGGNLFVYRPKTGGGYTEAPGSGATATYASQTTCTTTPATTVVITQHKPYEKDVFDPTTAMLVCRVDEDGNKQTFNYGGTFTGDGGKYLTSITDTAGRTITFNHPSFFETGVSDGTGRSVAYAFGGTGGSTSDLTSFTDATGSTGATAYQYDANDRVTQIKPPKDISSGAHYTITYDSTGRVTGLADPGGSCSGTVTKCTTFAYTNIATPGGTGQTVVTDPLGHATTYTWDNRDRMKKVTDALGNHRDATYNDTWDAPATESDGNSHMTSFSQDPIGNPKDTTAASGRKDTAGYNSVGGNAGDYNPTSISHDDGTAPTTFTPYSGTGHQWKASQGGVTVDRIYTYQGVGSPPGTCTGAVKGQLCTAMDGNGNTTTYAYSGSPKYQLTTVTPPLPAVPTTYTDDSLSRVSTLQQGSGPLTRYSYDNVDRVTKVQYNGITTCTSGDISAGNCVTFTYDGNGNLITRVDVTGTTTYGYTDRNQENSKNVPGSATPSSAIYDDAGNIYSYNDAGGTVTYTYDPANQLWALAEPGGSCPAYGGSRPIPNSTRCTALIVDPAGNRTAILYPSGEVVHYNHDAANRITSMDGTHLGAGGPFFSRTISYTTSPTAHVPNHDAALVQSITANQPGEFTYDDHNRLTNTGSGGEAFTYDQAGNRRTAVVPGVTGTLYAGYDNASQQCWTGNTDGATTGPSTPQPSCPALPGGNDVASTYDANGNQTNGGGVYTATYDTANRTTSITRAGATVNMTYAGLGQTERTAATGTTFFNGLEGITAQTSGGVTQYFTRDPNGTLISMRQGSGGTSTNSYYLLDQQGSVVAMTAADGVTEDASYTYDPWGVVTGRSGSLSGVNLFWWEGYYETNSELYKMGARYYNASTGSFTQVDPSGQDAPYAYAGDNPISNADPRGLTYLSIGGCISDPLGACFGVSLDQDGTVGVTAGPAAGVGGGA